MHQRLVHVPYIGRSMVKNDQHSLLSKASKVAEEIVHASIQLVKIGMKRQDILIIIQLQMAQRGIRKNWHRPVVRIGPATRLIFDDRDCDDRIVSNGDLVFIDIGIVFQGYEADFCQTFRITEQPYPTVPHAAKIWKELHQTWKLNPLITGKELYTRASRLASETYFLDSREGGHRIGQFPHSRQGPEFLKDFDQPVAPGEWILEIKLIHQTRDEGIFFEQILL